MPKPYHAGAGTAQEPALFKPVSPKQIRRDTVFMLLRELFQLNHRGAPESELRAQIARLEIEYARLNATED